MTEHESRQIAHEEWLGEVPAGSRARALSIRDEVLRRRNPARKREESCVPVFTTCAQGETLSEAELVAMLRKIGWIAISDPIIQRVVELKRPRYLDRNGGC